MVAARQRLKMLPPKLVPNEFSPDLATARSDSLCVNSNRKHIVRVLLHGYIFRVLLHGKLFKCIVHSVRPVTPVFSP